MESKKIELPKIGVNLCDKLLKMFEVMKSFVDSDDTDERGQAMMQVMNPRNAPERELASACYNLVLKVGGMSINAHKKNPPLTADEATAYVAVFSGLKYKDESNQTTTLESKYYDKIEEKYEAIYGYDSNIKIQLTHFVKDVFKGFCKSLSKDVVTQLHSEILQIVNQERKSESCLGCIPNPLGCFSRGR